MDSEHIKDFPFYREQVQTQVPREWSQPSGVLDARHFSFQPCDIGRLLTGNQDSTYKWFYRKLRFNMSQTAHAYKIQAQLTSVSRSDEVSGMELGEPVRRVLKEADPEYPRFLTTPTLAFNGRSPRGHPPSWTRISSNTQQSKARKAGNTPKDTMLAISRRLTRKRN